MQVKYTNRLIDEKSPYLLQHAHNPVDWYPWGNEAFEKAKKEDKPIFLSIGYSTCHWCHVMERESFEDEEVASILNKYFVSIKVDREERPDIDTIYMAVCQAMTGHGGWPLTVIMTPDRHPFFAGTYFPKQNSRGMPGLLQILNRIAELWRENKEEILTSGRQITESINESMFSHSKGEITKDTLKRAFEYFEASFDPIYGGFGHAPKFPTPHNLMFLMRYWRMTGNETALEIVKKTLDSMYLGGIYDHIGFGFARYSTDRKWLVPHFEKMLYDNALLAFTYIEAYQVTGSHKYAQAADQIFTYVLRDMTSPEGGFYSAEDADSEGEEGKFYVWTPVEIIEALGREEGDRFCAAYEITAKGNFEGKNIPNLIKTGYVEGFEDSREKLFGLREQRIHPFKDDKILTSWNGLMIAALAFGSRVLDKPEYTEAAKRAAGFVLESLRRSDGRLLARYRDGESAFPGYAEDYAFFIWGLIELYEATFDTKYLEQALELNDDLIKYFWDNRKGGLYHYGSDAENLITRPKEIYDGALPSANSVAALNFLRLSRLTERPDIADKATAQLAAFGGTANENPMSHTFFLTAGYYNIVPPVDVSIIGALDNPDTRSMVRAVNKHFIPELALAVAQSEKDAQAVPMLEKRQAVEGKPTAYICKNFACLEPVTSLEGVHHNLQQDSFPSPEE